MPFLNDPGLAALIPNGEASNKTNAVATRLHFSFRHFAQASLAHPEFTLGLAALIPNGEASNKTNAVASRLLFSFRHFAQASLAHPETKNAPFKGICFVWRRERDSNPRRLAPQRFSRPPHSTALPSLRCKNNIRKLAPKIFIGPSIR